MQMTPEAEPQFTQPIRQLVLMLLVVAAVLVGAVLAYPALVGVFRAKPMLNGFIGLVFLLGVLTCFWQVVQLQQSVRWIKGFVHSHPGQEMARAPTLLLPLATLLRSRGARMQISSSSSGSILESVAARIDEARDITRYLGNLLIFLGLLGTFYGLATTVPAVVDTIRTLAPQEGQTSTEVFGKLMTGLEGQLGGMGTAFSSSLLGLAGSLVVGLLELFASHGQNRFYRQLEEWLSSITRLGIAGGDGEGDQGAIAAVLEQLAGQMEVLQTLYTQSDINRSQVDDRISDLGAAVTRLNSTLAAESGQAALLGRIAEGQDRLVAALTGAEGGAHSDAESRMRLRSIDVQLLRILEEISAGRQETTADLRADLSGLTAAIRQLSRGSVGRG
ncbi:Mce/MlaD family protein [Rhodobacter ferrooxidans]|uniref:Biopolymer transporter ExbB n=1 Tax=Rhodobacter ferrooxidans TaxID=371731 RepID=C8S341_9RHOB|nr:hypothetical protein [Rhodobacter sp. SW2]EEW24681.1 conserved hypothetical protein [Rhodobacter sp. SW2]